MSNRNLSTQPVDTSTEAEAATPELPYLNPHQAHHLVNAYLRGVGIKEIRPQMMYNYTSTKVNKGEKPLIKWSLETGVDREDLERWVKKYVAKKQALAAAATAEAEIEAELADEELASEVAELAEVTESE